MHEHCSQGTPFKKTVLGSDYRCSVGVQKLNFNKRLARERGSGEMREEARQKVE